MLLTHEMLPRTAYGSASGRAFQDARRILFSLPMHHVYGYVEGMLAALFVGGAIIPQLSFDPVRTLREIERHKAALLQPEEVTTGYGMSETTASTTVTRPDDPTERLLTTNGGLRDVGVAGDSAYGGRLAVYNVVDPATGEELPRGSVGELLVLGPGVTGGYFRKPDENAVAFDEQGWLRTDDLGRLDDDYVSLVGRKKDCYRCGGEQVVPKEIEDVLTSHPAVSRAHVVPLPPADG